MAADRFFRTTELDVTSFPSWRDTILEANAQAETHANLPRTYPGCPTVRLKRPRARLWPSLDRALAARRSPTVLGTRMPSQRLLGRVLWCAHGITGPDARGPVPSAGGLQALELYMAAVVPGWLASGTYHYDRAGHYLSWAAQGHDRAGWSAIVPSLLTLDGAALLWLLVGDGARVQARYGARGLRFLLLEAGHLMQNLCLVCATLGLVTVPLGGYFEPAIARHLALPPGDEVLAVGACGSRRSGR